MKILHVDNHLLVVDKPAGMPSQPDSSGDTSLADQAKAWLKQKFSKPGNVYLGLVHRLDRPTSGIVLLARTDKAASRLSEQFRTRSVEKTYYALVECFSPPLPHQRLESWLVKLDNGSMACAAVNAVGAKPARLAYETVAHSGKCALLRIALETGIKHQIRCQLASVGLPVVGDFRYGPSGRPARPQPVRDGRAILLHAAHLACTHPVKKEPVAFSAPVPDYWDSWLDALPKEAAQAAKPH